MTPRLLAPDLRSTTLSPEPVAPEDVVEGSPTTAALTIGTVGGVEVGAWEMSEGTVRDTEVDEVFVVLSGRGTVTFSDGERLDLAPGVAVRLTAGERTEWTVVEKLRKVWVA